MGGGTPGEAENIFNLKQNRRGITGEVTTGGPGRPKDKASVAVHVASTGCGSLREGSYWCRNLIANGAAVTMGATGATGEPYLEAFVAPDEFLGLLLGGKSIGEAYYAWRMVLLGDPLLQAVCTAQRTGWRQARS